jgi:hypothetical protein
MRYNSWWQTLRLSVANKDRQHEFEFEEDKAYAIVSLGFKHEGGMCTFSFVGMTLTGYLSLSHEGRESVHDWSDGQFHSIIFSGQCQAQFLPVTDGEQVIIIFENDKQNKPYIGDRCVNLLWSK